MANTKTYKTWKYTVRNGHVKCTHPETKRTFTFKTRAVKTLDTVVARKIDEYEQNHDMTKSAKEETVKKNKKDVYDIVSERMINLMETQNILPWRRQWENAKGELCYNVVSGKAYSILNCLMLGNKPGAYGTFKQWSELGGKIKKGSHGQMVCFFQNTEYLKKAKTNDNETEEDDEKLKRYNVKTLKYYNVFSENDIEWPNGMPDKVKNVKMKTEAPFYSTDHEKLMESALREFHTVEGIKYRENVNSNEAYFMPSTDSITMPNPEQFKSQIGRLQAMAHETVHSTGHVSRLNRIEKGAEFGNESYSKEELVAEIGSQFLMNYFGVYNPKSEKMSVAYVQGWAAEFKADKKMFVQAAIKAQKAVDYILERVNISKLDTETLEEATLF